MQVRRKTKIYNEREFSNAIWVLGNLSSLQFYFTTHACSLNARYSSQSKETLATKIMSYSITILEMKLISEGNKLESQF